MVNVSARCTSRHRGPIIITPSTTYPFLPLSFPSFPLPILHYLLPNNPKSLHLSLSLSLPIAKYHSIKTFVDYQILNLICFFVVILPLSFVVMKGGLALLGGGGGSSNESTVEVVEATEGSSYPAESELELGLGLSLGGSGGGSGKSKASGGWGESGRILTAKDFPSVASQGHRGASVGTKRAADSVSHEGGSPGVSQVVGWPPIGAHRMSSLVNQAKAPRAEEDKATGEKDKSKDGLKKKIYSGNKICATVNDKGHLGFVKVNMDGIPIGRKVDLNAHACYETLAQALEEMFLRSTSSISSIGSCREKEQAKASRLLDGSSEFVLTYEDKEGDWMLVGDVPWGMFLSSVRRLRIMRTSEANGLGPRFQERNERQRSKLV